MSDDPLEQAVAAANAPPAPSIRDMIIGLLSVDQLREVVREQLKTIETLRPYREWRPIETAPRCGMQLLLWVPNGGWLTGFFNGATGRWDDGEYRDDLRPTHWMPLPEPPE